MSDDSPCVRACARERRGEEERRFAGKEGGEESQVVWVWLPKWHQRPSHCLRPGPFFFDSLAVDSLTAICAFLTA